MQMSRRGSADKFVHQAAEQPLRERLRTRVPAYVRAVRKGEIAGGEGAIRRREERQVDDAVTGGIDAGGGEALPQGAEGSPLVESLREEVDLAPRTEDGEVRLRAVRRRARLCVHMVGAVDEEIGTVHDATAEEGGIFRVQCMKAHQFFLRRCDDGGDFGAPRRILRATIEEDGAERRHGVRRLGARRPRQL